jgi:hypothetical protein
MGYIQTRTKRTYVAVFLYVSTHVFMSSKPVVQSRLPVLDNSSAVGGTETGYVSASVVVAPNMREPPRKQARWSCFADRIHSLSRKQESVRTFSGTDLGDGDVHLSSALTVRDELGGVC